MTQRHESVNQRILIVTRRGDGVQLRVDDAGRMWLGIRDQETPVDEAVLQALHFIAGNYLYGGTE